MDLSLLSDREGFRLHVAEALARVPVDYLAQLEFIDEQRKSERIWAGGGILLPLYFLEDQEQAGDTSGHYVILLSKRSKEVQQPGDLCAPGGGIHPVLDSLFGKLLRFGLLPGIHGPGLALAKRQGNPIYEKNLSLIEQCAAGKLGRIASEPFQCRIFGSIADLSSPLPLVDYLPDGRQGETLLEAKT